MTQETVKVGIMGCGNISNAYIKGCRSFDILEVVAVADIVPERAEEKAAEHGIARALSTDELLAQDDIDVIINLTIPAVHADVSQAILASGKHAYSEKPLATNREDGRAVLTKADAAGLRIGCAPDTFLGGGLQTCRKVIDEGLIGAPVAATGFFMTRGLEDWHPNPAFFFQPGAGPLFDMGPYYLTALINLLGPVKSVTGSAVKSFEERLVTSQPLAGQYVKVDTPTHITGLLEFESGVAGTLMTSFDVRYSQVPRIEIYGDEGTLSVPDPNTFGGPVKVRRKGDEDWEELALTHPYTSNMRGLGVADLAYASQSGRKHRANGQLAFHVLDVMQSILEAAEARTYRDVDSRCEQPAPLPTGLTEGQLDT